LRNAQVKLFDAAHCEENAVNDAPGMRGITGDIAVDRQDFVYAIGVGITIGE
jgi:hypothetical protein